MDVLKMLKLVVEAKQNLEKKAKAAAEEEVCKKNMWKVKKLAEEVRVYTATRRDDEVDGFPASLGRKRLALYFMKKEDAEVYVRRGNQGQNDVVYDVMEAPLSQVIDDNWNCRMRILRWMFPDLLPSRPARLMPDICELKNAQQVINNKSGGVGGGVTPFSGIPVFQSDALCMMVDGYPDPHYPFFDKANRRRPVFFKKADLERALSQVKQSNQGDIQVTAFEDIIRDIKLCPTSKWNDIVFIPPGGAILPVISPHTKIETQRILAYCCMKIIRNWPNGP